MPKGTMPLRFAPQPRILPRPLPGSRPTPARLPPDFCSSPARREGRSVLTVPDLPPPGRPTPAEGVRRRRASWREFLMDALARRGRSHSGIAHAPVAGAPRPQRGSFGIVFLSSLFFSVFACHSLPPALRRVGPARRGTVLCGSALKLSPVVKPAKWRTVCGTTSGGAREPGCRRTAHCRQRRFASSTAVSPILRDSALRRMGERSVGVTDCRWCWCADGGGWGPRRPSRGVVLLQCCPSVLLPVTPGFTFSGTSLVVLELPGSTGMVGASAVHRWHDASRMPWFHHRTLAL